MVILGEAVYRLTIKWCYEVKRSAQANDAMKLLLLVSRNKNEKILNPQLKLSERGIATLFQFHYAPFTEH